MLVAPAVGAAEYECPVTKKLNAERVFSEDEMKKWQFSVKIEDLAEGSFVSRCSVSSGKTECLRLRVDRLEHDRHIGAKKFYAFRSQVDVQLFRDLSFVDNNGRGGLAFGHCSLVAP